MLKIVKQNPAATIFFLLALFIGFYTRIVMPQLAYTEFQGDQSRDSFVHANILSDGFVPYGPVSSIGKYTLAGGYYTLMFIFSFGNSNPNFHLLSNSIFSFLTIPLFGLLIYRAFSNFKNSILVASFGSLLWSIFATDIFFAGFQWNPNSVTFFWILLIVNFELLYSHKIALKFVNWIWALQGLVFGILLSLHSSSMFVVPLIFAINLIYICYIQKTWRWLWTIPGFLLIMLPYLLAEIQNGFQNTSNIFDTIFIQAKEPHTLVEKLDHLLDPIKGLAAQVYFPFTSMPTLSFGLMLTTVVLGIVFYKGRQFYLCNYLLLLGLFLLVANSYWGPIFKHFMVLIWSVPMFFAISLVFSIPKNGFKKYISIALLILGFGFYAQQNLEGIDNIYQNKFGVNRVVNLFDMKLALSKIPSNSSVCSPTYGNSLKYLNFIGSGKVQTSENCQNSNYEFVESYKPSDFYPASKNPYNLDNKNVLFKSDSFSILKLK
jgi:hypothetical protein